MRRLCFSSRGLLLACVGAASRTSISSDSPGGERATQRENKRERKQEKAARKNQQRPQSGPPHGYLYATAAAQMPNASPRSSDSPGGERATQRENRRERKQEKAARKNQQRPQSGPPHGYLYATAAAQMPNASPRSSRRIRKQMRKEQQMNVQRPTAAAPSLARPSPPTFRSLQTDLPLGAAPASPLAATATRHDPSASPVFLSTVLPLDERDPRRNVHALDVGALLAAHRQHHAAETTAAPATPSVTASPSTAHHVDSSQHRLPTAVAPAAGATVADYQALLRQVLLYNAPALTSVLAAITAERQQLEQLTDRFDKTLQEAMAVRDELRGIATEAAAAANARRDQVLARIEALSEAEKK